MADVTLTVADLIGILKAHERAWGALIVSEPERRAIIAALERAQRVERAMKEVAIRTEGQPAWYRRDQEWYVTDFTHDQVEGNRSRMHELAISVLEGRDG